MQNVIEGPNLKNLAKFEKIGQNLKIFEKILQFSTRFNSMPHKYDHHISSIFVTVAECCSPLWRTFIGRYYISYASLHVKLTVCKNPHFLGSPRKFMSSPSVPLLCR